MRFSRSGRCSLDCRSRGWKRKVFLHFNVSLSFFSFNTYTIINKISEEGGEEREVGGEGRGRGEARRERRKGKGKGKGRGRRVYH